MLKIQFSLEDIYVEHDSLNFAVAAKKGFECSLGFANAKGHHKMVDFVIDGISQSTKDHGRMANIRFLIKDPESQPIATTKEFTVHMKDGDVYEFSELEG